MQKNKAAGRFFGPSALVALVSVLVALLHFLKLGGQTSRPFSYIITALLASVAFGLPSAAYCFLKSDGFLEKIAPKSHLGDTRPVGLFGAVLLILQGSILKFGIFRLKADFSAHAIYGISLENPSGIWESILAAVALAAVPAVLEETLFRGIIFSEYSRKGFLCAAVVSSLFFTFVQFDPAGFFVCFAEGMLLSWMVFLCGSFAPAVIARMIYNIFTLFFERYVYLASSNPESRPVFWLIFGGMYLFGLFAFISLGKKLILKRAEAGLEPPAVLPKKRVPGAILSALASPPAVICILLYVVVSLIILI